MAKQTDIGHRITPTLLAYLDNPRALLSSWGELKRSAACRAKADTDIFFVAENASVSPAQLICDQCPINTACLAYALIRKEEYGVWGGLTIRGRKAIQRALKRRAA